MSGFKSPETLWPVVGSQYTPGDLISYISPFHQSSQLSRARPVSMKNPSLERRRLIGVSSTARRQPSVSQVMGPGASLLSVGQSTTGLLQSLEEAGSI